MYKKIFKILTTITLSKERLVIVIIAVLISIIVTCCYIFPGPPARPMTVIGFDCKYVSASCISVIAELRIPSCTARYKPPFETDGWMLYKNATHGGVVTTVISTAADSKENLVQLVADSKGTWRIFRKREIGFGMQAFSTKLASSPDNNITAIMIDTNISPYGDNFEIYTYNWTTNHVLFVTKGVLLPYMVSLISCTNDGQVCYGSSYEYEKSYGDAYLIDSSRRSIRVGKYLDILANNQGIFGVNLGNDGNLYIHQIVNSSGAHLAQFEVPNTFIHGIEYVACADDGNEWVIMEKSAEGKVGGMYGLFQAITDPFFSENNLKLAVWDRAKQRMSRTYDFTSQNITGFVPQGVIIPGE